MQSHTTEAQSGQLRGRAGLAAAIGAVLIALSLLRWPATAMLVSPASGLPATPWGMLVALQVGAEAMFWVGVWLAGRNALGPVLARVAGTWPVQAIFARGARGCR